PAGARPSVHVDRSAHLWIRSQQTDFQRCAPSVTFDLVERESDVVERIIQGVMFKAHNASESLRALGKEDGLTFLHIVSQRCFDRVTYSAIGMIEFLIESKFELKFFREFDYPFNLGCAGSNLGRIFEGN